MYDRKKIDDQRSVFRRVFPPKNALPTKRLIFYSPGEFVGRSSEPQRKMRKQRILSCTANGPVLPQNQPRKRKKRPKDRSVENFENGGGGGDRTRVL